MPPPIQPLHTLRRTTLELNDHEKRLVQSLWLSRQWDTVDLAKLLNVAEAVVANHLARLMGPTEPASGSASPAGIASQGEAVVAAVPSRS